MKTEKHEHKGHKIRVSCEERGPNGDLYWRVSITKDGKLIKHEPGPKPFDTRFPRNQVISWLGGKENNENEKETILAVGDYR